MSSLGFCEASELSESKFIYCFYIANVLFYITDTSFSNGEILPFLTDGILIFDLLILLTKSYFISESLRCYMLMLSMRSGAGDLS